MNPDGWNGAREAGNHQHDLGTIDKKETIPGGWKSQERQELLNIIMEERDDSW